MENYNSVKVVGKGNVKLLFTSDRKLFLLNVSHVPDMKKNRMFVDLLNKKASKLC